MNDKDRADVKAIVDEALRAHSSLSSIKKNGDSFSAWLDKIVTTDRILWLITTVIVLVYTYGGKVAVMTRDTEEAIETAATATQQTAGLSKKVDGLNDFVMSQAAERTKENQATRAVVAALEDKVNRTATRQELRDTVQREILPRLNRIEAMTKQIGP